MAIKRKKPEYHSGKMGAIVGTIIGILKAHPEFIDNIDLLKAHVYLAIPELADKSKCPNCSASMKEYTYKFDKLDALLLIAIANEVKRNTTWFKKDFTSANNINVQQLPVEHSVMCRTTQASKLGLIAPVLSKNNKRVPGHWLITRRGWTALRGERVPKKIKLWRKRIEEKYEETTTLGEVLQDHPDYKNYNSNDWYEYSLHQGILI